MKAATEAALSILFLVLLRSLFAVNPLANNPTVIIITIITIISILIGLHFLLRPFALHLCGQLNGFLNSQISTTATNISFHCILDIFFSRVLILLHQHGC